MRITITHGFLWALLTVNPLMPAAGFGSGTEPEKPSDRLHAVFQELADACHGSPWTAQQRPLSREQLVQAASLLQQETRARAVLENLQSARSLQWSLAEGSQRHIALHVHCFENDADARGYFTFALDLLRKQDELWNQPGQPVQVVDSRSRPLRPPIRVTESTRIDKRLLVAPSTEPLTVTTFLVRSETVCLELTWFNLPPDEDWTWRVLGRVLLHINL